MMLTVICLETVIAIVGVVDCDGLLMSVASEFTVSSPLWINVDRLSESLSDDSLSTPFGAHAVGPEATGIGIDGAI